MPDRNGPEYDGFFRRAVVHPSVGRRSSDSVVVQTSSREAARAYAQTFPGAQMPSSGEKCVIYAVDSFGYAQKTQAEVPLIDFSVSEEKMIEDAKTLLQRASELHGGNLKLGLRQTLSRVYPGFNGNPDTPENTRVARVLIAAYQLLQGR